MTWTLASNSSGWKGQAATQKYNTEKNAETKKKRHRKKTHQHHTKTLSI